MKCLIIFLTIIILDVIWHIRQYIKIKHLDKCWNDLFDAKLNSESRYQEMLSAQLRTILELQEKISDLTKEDNSHKLKKNK